MKLLSFIKKKILGFKNWFLHTSWKKRTAVIILVIIILFILKGIIAPNKKNPYTFDTVQKGSINQLVTETGNVIASNETDVYSPTNGVLDQLFVKDGDNIKAGDKLFTVRSTATAQEAATAYANYQSAISAEKTAEQNQIADQSQLEQDRSAVITASSNVSIADNRASALQPNPATGSMYSQNDLNVIHSTLTSAQETFKKDEKKYNEVGIAIAAAQASINSTKLAYDATQNTTVTAPSDGNIANIIGLAGAKVQAQVSSSQTTATTTTVTPVLIIGSQSTSAIQTTVSEVDVNKVTLGQKVDITFSAVPNKTYTGHIIQIDSYGTNTSGVITYNVFINMDNPDMNIKPNMTSNLTIYTAQKSDILTVANAAIVPYQNGKAIQVFDAKNNKVKFIPVIIGLKGFARSEVISGVQPGTKVILGNTQLTNNQNSGGGGGGGQQGG